MSSTSTVAAVEQEPSKIHYAGASEYRRTRRVLLAEPGAVELVVPAAHTEKDAVDSIVAFCPYAGKPGRPRPENQHNSEVQKAILGATVMWLVSNPLNSLISRLERTTIIRHLGPLLPRRADKSVIFPESDTSFPANLCRNINQSHTIFLDRLKGLFEADGKAHEFEEYKTCFVTSPLELRKYGNAGVCHPTDLKCLHALVGQTLGGAPNPLGDATVQLIFHIHATLTKERQARIKAVVADTNVIGEKRPADRPEEDEKGSQIEEDDSVAILQALTAQVDSLDFISDFFKQSISGNDWNRVDVIGDAEMEAKCRLLPRHCRDILEALELPSRRGKTKKRLN